MTFLMERDSGFKVKPHSHLLGFNSEETPVQGALHSEEFQAWLVLY